MNAMQKHMMGRIACGMVSFLLAQGLLCALPMSKALAAEETEAASVETVAAGDQAVADDASAEEAAAQEIAVAASEAPDVCEETEAITAETTDALLDEVVAETPADMTSVSQDGADVADVTDETIVSDEDAATETDASQDDAAEAAASEEGDGEVSVEETAGVAEEESVEVTAAATTSDLPATPSTAVSVDEGTYVLQSEITSDRVIQAVSIKKASTLKTAAYTGATNQQWVVVREGNSNWYRLLAAENTALALIASTDSEGNIVPKLGVVTTIQKANLLKLLWSFVNAGKGSYQMVNATDTSLRLGVKGAKTAAGTAMAMPAAKATSAKSQRIKLIKRTPSVSAGDVDLGGSFYVKLNGTSLVAGVETGRKNGANASIATSTGTGEQRIYLERGDDGFYTAWVVGSGKVLSVKGSSLLSGTNVHQWAYKNNDRQKWALTAVTNADGTVSYRLQNKGTGLYLSAVSTKDGANLVGKSSGETNMDFTLTETSLMGKGVYTLYPQATSKVTMQVRKQSTGTAGLVLWSTNGSLGQRFELVSAGGTDLWRIRTGSSGGWVTWVGGSKVQQTGTGKTAASSRNTWRAVWVKGGVSLVNVAAEEAGQSLALDTSWGKSKKGTAIVVRKSTGVVSQHFVYEPTQLVAEGFYFLRNGGGTYLQVAKTSAANGANIQVGKYTGGMGQFFQVLYTDTYTKIRNIFSRKYLQIVSNAAGANVTQRKENSSKKQLWHSVIVDGGKVAFVSAANAKLVLEAVSNGKKSGANVRVATNVEKASQTWKPVTLPAAATTATTAKQKAVIRSAKRTASPGKGLCAAWVSSVIANAGIGSWNGDACDLYANWCKQTSLNKLRPGMIVAVSSHSHTSAGRIWGHVGVYIGNGLIMDNVGPIRTMSVYEWLSWYGDLVTPKWGWLGGKSLK